MTTTQKSDATSAYRGYRLQTLYTLSRILSDSKHRSFRPKSKEDLEILDCNCNTVEIVQVKAHSDPLTLSNFSPDKEDSFFRRVAEELKAQTHINISIVSFGKFGPELELALNGDERKQTSVAKKLAGHDFLNDKEAKQLLSKIQPIVVEEAPVRERIDAALRENSITGGDHDAAFDSLMFWLYQCAEQKTEITHLPFVGGGCFGRSGEAWLSEKSRGTFPPSSKFRPLFQTETQALYVRARFPVG
ncbi:MAG: hypothetical protein GY801_02165 [bacterium]|nr:hypothetical protein [bacterium]